MSRDELPHYLFQCDSLNTLSLWCLRSAELSYDSINYEVFKTEFLCFVHECKQTMLTHNIEKLNAKYSVIYHLAKCKHCSMHEQVYQVQLLQALVLHDHCRRMLERVFSLLTEVKVAN